MADRPMNRPPLSPPLALSSWSRTEGDAHAGQTVVVLPVGSLEQHGHHLPAGTDAMLAEHIAQEAAREVATDVPVTVAPVLGYGCSQHHLPFGVTASLRTETYLAVLRDLLGSLAESGFQRIFVLNGHGGNHEAVRIAVRDVGLERRLYLAAASYYELARVDLETAGAHRLGEVPGHAGAFETSLMLAVRPDLVRSEALPEGPVPAEPERNTDGPSYRYVGPGPFRGGRGFSDRPARARADRGHQLLRTCTAATARALRAFHSTTEERT
jgi:creatinine amidohydrolase